MSGVLDRAADAFRAATDHPAGTLPRFAPRALVLGRPEDAVPVAAALAGGLRERDRSAGALLVVWPATTPPRAALGTPAASRLAARLQARGLPAVARGRLAWLALGHDELALVERATGAVDIPSVIAVTGPRTPATDALLAEQDVVMLVIAVEGEPELTALALAGFEAAGARVVVRGPIEAPGARPAALAGWGRLRLDEGRE